MGTSAHVVVRGGHADLVEIARRRIAELETRWSRFNPRSEISLLNHASHGRPTIVSPDTYRLVDTAMLAWRQTNGRYDPTVLAAMLANGYDRTFESIGDDHNSTCLPQHPRPAPGCLGIQLDPNVRSIVLPESLGIDPGGIGKGLAADIVAGDLLTRGADGALVDIGGDIRVVGEGPYDGAWIIDVEHPLDPDRTLLHLALRDAGVATSSTLRRRWTQGGIDRHHLIDPTTGRPIVTPVVAATVISAPTWWAEALTKAILVAGDLAPARDASAVTVDEDGTTHATPDLEKLLT